MMDFYKELGGGEAHRGPVGCDFLEQLYSDFKAFFHLWSFPELFGFVVDGETYGHTTVYEISAESVVNCTVLCTLITLVEQ